MESECYDNAGCYRFIISRKIMLVTYIPCDDAKDEIRLTPDGESLLKKFEEFASNFDQDVTYKFNDTFK